MFQSADHHTGHDDGLRRVYRRKEFLSVLMFESNFDAGIMVRYDDEYKYETWARRGYEQASCHELGIGTRDN